MKHDGTSTNSGKIKELKAWIQDNELQ